MDYTLMNLIMVIVAIMIPILVYLVLNYQKGTPNRDYHLEVSRNNMEGKKTLYKFGYNADVDSTEEIIRLDPTAVSFPSEEFTAYINSNSSTDSQTGIGAKKVKISGLDENYDEQSITVDLDGTTIVQVGSGVSWIRIFRAQVVDSGTQGGTSGTITIGNNDVSTVYATIDSNNQTLIGVYTVPRNYTLYLDDITFTGSLDQQNKYSIVKAQVREFGTNTFNTKFMNVLRSSKVMYQFEYPLKIKEKSDIQLTAQGSGDDSAKISGTFQGVLVKNS
jgi:hypothetical protein